LLVDHSALHHEADAGELADVRQGISLHGDYVTELSIFDGAEAVRLIEELRNASQARLDA
jgi:hypothetical protein